MIKGAFKSGATLGFGCVVVQAIVNEGEIMRIKTIGWAEERQSRLRELDATTAKDGLPPKAAPPTYTRSISSPTPSVPSRETFSERSDRLFEGAFVWITDSLARISPVKKIDDLEYETTLHNRLREVERAQELRRVEMEQLQSQISAEESDESI